MWLVLNSYGQARVFAAFEAAKGSMVRFKPHHEKTVFAYVKNKAADQLHSNRAADQHLYFRCIGRTIPLLFKSEISSLLPSSLAA